MRRSTMNTYTIPVSEVAPTTCAGSFRWCHGALRTAAKNNTATKWSTLGVPNALIVSGLRGSEDSRTRATTTNIKPVRPPADDPTMTQKLSHCDSSSCADVSISPHLEGQGGPLRLVVYAVSACRHHVNELDVPLPRRADDESR